MSSQQYNLFIPILKSRELNITFLSYFTTRVFSEKKHRKYIHTSLINQKLVRQAQNIKNKKQK